MNATATLPTYYAHIDGLRALAVLCVLLYHQNPAWLPGGFVGVDGSDDGVRSLLSRS